MHMPESAAAGFLDWAASVRTTAGHQRPPCHNRQHLTPHLRAKPMRCDRGDSGTAAAPGPTGVSGMSTTSVSKEGPEDMPLRKSAFRRCVCSCSPRPHSCSPNRLPMAARKRPGGQAAA